jgi:hypothetical protein
LKGRKAGPGANDLSARQQAARKALANPGAQQGTRQNVAALRAICKGRRNW